MSKNRYVVVFAVRNDKQRGILIESITTNTKMQYFFKHHDQPLHRHCINLQNIILSTKVIRSKKITVDITSFVHEYYDNSRDTMRFRNCDLISTQQQIQKVRDMNVNKIIGKIKQQKTIAKKKQADIEKHNQELAAKFIKEEEDFQNALALRIAELQVEGSEKKNEKMDVN